MKNINDLNGDARNYLLPVCDVRPVYDARLKTS